MQRMFTEKNNKKKQGNWRIGLFCLSSPSAHLPPLHVFFRLFSSFFVFFVSQLGVVAVRVQLCYSPDRAHPHYEGMFVFMLIVNPLPRLFSSH